MAAALLQRSGSLSVCLCLSARLSLCVCECECVQVRWFSPSLCFGWLVGCLLVCVLCRWDECGLTFGYASSVVFSWCPAAPRVSPRHILFVRILLHLIPPPLPPPLCLFVGLFGCLLAFAFCFNRLPLLFCLFDSFLLLFSVLYFIQSSLCI